VATQVLTPAQLESFTERGWCAVEDCFPRSAAQQKINLWIEEQGFDPANPLEWGPPIMHRGLKERFLAKEFAPKAYAAVEDLVGPGRIDNWTWGGFIVNTKFKREEKPWKMPAKNEGWHIDGDFFHHFLDSREQSLLAVQVFTDMAHGGGCTVTSEGSYKPIARMMRQHPEGLDPGGVCREAIAVTEFGNEIELEAKAGTVVFLHPFMLHASSPNTDGPARFIMNAVPILKDHFRFDNWENASVVERATILACGGKPFTFTATGERIRYTPNRSSYEKK
jgi:hypothetical protein